jgi:hypothetical protein
VWNIEILGMSPLWIKRLTVVTDWMTQVAALSLAVLVVTIASHIHWRANWRSDFDAPQLAVLVGESLFWLGLSALLTSFVEHQIHSNLMHRKNFLSKHAACFKRVFEAHAIVHHQHYSGIFCDGPAPQGADKEIHLTLHKAPLKAMPIATAIALVSLPGAVIFLAVVTFHHWVWNNIHLEMHKPTGRFFRTWPAYKFLARHHYLHHRYPNKNFNVVFPFADYVLRTSAHASKDDLAEMRQRGFL